MACNKLTDPLSLQNTPIFARLRGTHLGIDYQNRSVRGLVHYSPSFCPMNYLNVIDMVARADVV